MTLPWFYAHWILIGSLSKVLLTELFTSRSPSKCRFTVKYFFMKIFKYFEGQSQRQRLADQERQIFGVESNRQRHRWQIFLVVFIRSYFKPIRVRSTENEELEVFNLLHGNKSQAGTSSTSYQKDGKSDDKDVIMNAVQYRRASLQVYH